MTRKLLNKTKYPDRIVWDSISHNLLEEAYPIAAYHTSLGVEVVLVDKIDEKQSKILIPEHKLEELKSMSL